MSAPEDAVTILVDKDSLWLATNSVIKLFNQAGFRVLFIGMNEGDVPHARSPDDQNYAYSVKHGYVFATSNQKDYIKLSDDDKSAKKIQ